MLVKLCFPLYFIPLDPDPWTQINADPTGSGSTSLQRDKMTKILLDHKKYTLIIRKNKNTEKETEREKEKKCTKCKRRLR